ncbi:hypothetical protein E4P41_09255, partial [Geodermatophilus sp. DF01-2]|uniref:hypothetical protein n=1 Tax=Geodermatophilus sp. DF01-2 TaxID=2559610 RepID=UPI001104CF0E
MSMPRRPEPGIPTAGGGRPPHVLLAAVAGFVEAGFLLLAALASFTFSVAAGLFAVFGVLYLALAVACAWGGVAALQGRGRRLLVASGAVAGALGLTAVVVGIASGTGFALFPALILLLGVTAVVLLLQAPAREYFTAARRP